jgi:hypothetical protein
LTLDPFVNLTSKDPEINGYMFYILNQVAGGPGVWSQFTPTADFGAATLQKVRIAVLENKAVDAGAKAAVYVAADALVAF